MQTDFSRTMKLLTVLALVLFLGATAVAQRLDGTLTGTVTDPQGAVVPGAKVTVINEATGVSLTAETTNVGSFTFPSLLVASYTVRVEKSGFKTYENKGVNVLANQVTEVRARMVLGVATEAVEVTTGAEMVETTTSQLSNTYGSRLVTDLPITTIAGDAMQLAMFSPNTTTAGGGVIGQGGSVGGSRPRTNSFNIDGVDDNNVGVTGPLSAGSVIQDSVAEFDLLTNQFSAEYGNGSGGQFNLVTKSGTNNVHGEFHWYNQNRRLNSRTNLDPPDKPRFDYNRLGVSAGGPIVKDKVFFFGAYQYQTQGVQATPTKLIAPTGAGLGILNTIAGSQGFTQVQNILNYFPVSGAGGLSEPVHDPLGATGLAPCVPGPPPNCSATVVSVPEGELQFFAPNFFAEHDFNTNVDVNLGKHQFRSRFFFDRFRGPNVNPSLPIPIFNGSLKSDTRKLLFSDVWAISDHWINDFRASYSRNLTGFSVGSTFPNFPNVEIDPLNINVGPEGNSPQGGAQNTYQLLDNVAWIHGKHTVKFGAQFINWIAPSLFLPRKRGEWDYSALDPFVNDLVPEGLNGALRGAGQAIFAGNQRGFFWFVQDDFRVTTRLTLNLGLRYEWVSIARDSGTQAINSISSCAPVDPVTCPSFLVFRKPKSDTNNFSPRVGFAWDPTGSGKWAIRGGGMIAFDKSPQNFALLSLPPQLQTEQNPLLTCSIAPAPAWCTNPYLFAWPNPNYTVGLGRGFLQLGGLNQLNVPCATTLDCRASTQGRIWDYTQPKSVVWTLSVERELFKKTKLEVRYLGTRGISLPVQVRTATQSGFDAGLTGLPTFFSVADIPATMPLTSPTRAQWTAFVGLGNACLPGGYYRYAAAGFCPGLVTQFPPIGQSTYHAGSVDFTHAFDHGLYLRANYTFAKTIDNATNELFSSRVNPRRAQNGNQITQDRGRSVLDIRHKFALSAVYDFPNIHLESGFGRAFLHDWEVSTTYLAQTGQPITPLSGVDANANGDSAGDRAIFNPTGDRNIGTQVTAVCMNTITGATNISPTGSPTSGCVAGTTVVGYVFNNPNAGWGVAQRGAISTAGRNVISSNGFSILDMGVSKKVHVTESKYFLFRVDARNVMNHRNFAIGAPSIYESDANALSTSYSFVSSAQFLDQYQFSGGRRTIQLGLKFIF